MGEGDDRRRSRARRGDEQWIGEDARAVGIVHAVDGIDDCRSELGVGRGRRVVDGYERRGVDGDAVVRVELERDDGYNAAVTFEFDSDDSVTNTATLIAIDYTAGTTDAQLQTAIMTAVNGATLFIAATAGTAPVVTLTNERAAKLGNQAITKGGPNSGADVTVSGMAGGLAGDCPATTPCLVDADCASLDCSNTSVCL